MINENTAGQLVKNQQNSHAKLTHFSYKAVGLRSDIECPITSKLLEIFVSQEVNKSHGISKSAVDTTYNEIKKISSIVKNNEQEF